MNESKPITFVFEVETGYPLRAKHYYDSYTEFCKKYNYNPDSKEKFIQNMKPHFDDWNKKYLKKASELEEIENDSSSDEFFIYEDGVYRLNEKAVYNDYIHREKFYKKLLEGLERDGWTKHN